MSAPSSMRWRVVIVGKTHMKSGICIGGILDSGGQPVRLFPVGHASHPIDTAFQIGEIWEMNLSARFPVTPPHVEDHEEWNAIRVAIVPHIAAYIQLKVQPVRGEPRGLFEGMIGFRPSGTAYVDVARPLPSSSVGFWILPRPLVYAPYDDKPKYRMDGATPFRVPYVGVAPLVKVVPAGTLVRVSLARPWTNANDPAEHTRCSVQLSGWY